MNDTMDGDVIGGDRDIVSPNPSFSPLARGELDVQIMTAKANRRSIKTFLQDAESMATVNEAVADGCIYAIPRDGKNIEGPSVRLAEIMLSAWGNVHCAARVTAVEARVVVAEAVAWDLERNLRIGIEARRKIVTKTGQRFGDDMIEVTAAAAMSVALRNAAFRIIPTSYVQQIYLKCKAISVGDATTLADRRSKMLGHFQKLGVKDDRLFAAMGVKGLEEIDLEKLGILKGMATAIRDGDLAVDDAFPDPTGAAEAKAKREERAGTAPQGNKISDTAAALAAARTAAPAAPAAPAGSAAPFAPTGTTSAPAAVVAPAASEPAKPSEPVTAAPAAKAPATKPARPPKGAVGNDGLPLAPVESPEDHDF